ncbi:hypothetical protein [Synergistes jonesii]|uniref:hypothetical protein n=1 Tax=Synergistes jonesii TaxID=2754 RepID=UPI003330B7AE
MKKTICMLVALAAALLAASCAFAARERVETVRPASELIDERQTDIWVEGERLGEMILGARGAIQIIYVDEAMSKAIASDVSLPQWVFEMGRYYGTDPIRKKKLFIAHVDVYKPWDFDYTKVFVGEHRLRKEDILSPSMTNPFGPQPSKSEGYFAFAIPASGLKAGKEIKIGYGDYSEIWKILK